MDYSTFAALVDATFYSNNNKEITAVTVNDFMDQVGETLVFTKKTTVTSAEILQLNSTPKLLVPGIPGKILRFVGWDAKWAGRGASYATNTTTFLRHVGSGSVFLVSNAAVPLTTTQASGFTQMSSLVITSNSGNILEGAGIELGVNTGNPTAGDFDIDVFVHYKVITP